MVKIHQIDLEIIINLKNQQIKLLEDKLKELNTQLENLKENKITLEKELREIELMIKKGDVS